MWLAIVDIFASILIIVLFIRYFVEKYQYYGYGPVLYGIVEVTNRILLPFRRMIPYQSQFLYNHLPLAAIVVVIVARGLLITLFRLGMVNPLEAVAVSFQFGLIIISQLVIAFLFASMMVSKRGVMMCSNAGFSCFQEKTFAVFKAVRRLIHTDNLVMLFLVSSLIILLACSLLSGLLLYPFAPDMVGYIGAVVTTFFAIIQNLLNYYMILLLLAILSSWIAADQFSVSIQIIRSMTDPYLNIFRRLCPWARIDFIDLSPIFAFIVISPVLTSLVNSILVAILNYLTQSSSSELIL